jgi:hypothetical protein
MAYYPTLTIAFNVTFWVTTLSIAPYPTHCSMVAAITTRLVVSSEAGVRPSRFISGEPSKGSPLVRDADPQGSQLPYWCRAQ